MDRGGRTLPALGQCWPTAGIDTAGGAPTTLGTPQGDTWGTVWETHHSGDAAKGHPLSQHTRAGGGTLEMSSSWRARCARQWTQL